MSILHPTRRNVQRALEPWQGRGVGKALLHRLADRARNEGITQFTALMLSDNRAMRRLLEGRGFDLFSRADQIRVSTAVRSPRASPVLGVPLGSIRRMCASSVALGQ